MGAITSPTYARVEEGVVGEEPHDSAGPETRRGLPMWARCGMAAASVVVLAGILSIAAPRATGARGTSLLVRV